MSDLHKRLAHWKAMSRPASNTLEGVDPLWLEQERADLALDALAAVLNCNAGACGNPMLCPTRCKADKEAGTILRELRGATPGEGGS